MATEDCRLVLIRQHREERREREICTLVDLSYAGLRFRAKRPLGAGEVVDFLIDLNTPARRSGFTRAWVRWIRQLGRHECEAGAEFSEESKGMFLGSEEAGRKACPGSLIAAG